MVPIRIHSMGEESISSSFGRQILVSCKQQQKMGFKKQECTLQAENANAFFYPRHACAVRVTVLGL